MAETASSVRASGDVGGKAAEIAFRRAAGSFPTGVTVVTTTDGQGVAGVTVSAFASVSLEPLQVLVSIGHESRVLDFLKANGRFAVNVLADDQADLSSRFADPARAPVVPSFADVQVRTEATGCPVFERALAYFDCRTAHEFVAGDHTIFVGRVEAVGYRDEGGALVYWRSGYYRLGCALT